MALGLLDEEVQSGAVCRGLKDEQAEAVGQMGHVDAGEGIIRQKPHLLTCHSLLDGLAQPQGRDGTAMAARIDQDLIGRSGHGLALDRDAGHMALLGTRLALQDLVIDGLDGFRTSAFTDLEPPGNIGKEGGPYGAQAIV